MASNIGPLANTCPADAPSQGITGPPVPTASPLAAATPAPTAAATPAPTAAANPAPIDATQAPEIPAPPTVTAAPPAAYVAGRLCEQVR